MKHLEENTIQAFLDGELSGEAMEIATRHLSLCDGCTAALLAAEAEMADLNQAFAAESFCPIPTQRIWARIENEIDFLHTAPVVQAENKTFWQQISAFVSPSQIAFAGALGAVVLVSLLSLNVIENQTVQPNAEINVAVAETPRATEITPVFVPEMPPSRPLANPVKVNNYAAQTDEPRIIKANYVPKPEVQINKIQNAAPQSAIRNPELSDRPLSEEKDYLNAIAVLSKSVNADRDLEMNPSFQVEYQRSVAMMNSAIKTMQKRARRNPNDDNAKRILLASYQNKIDLLNTVADKSQMIATLR